MPTIPLECSNPPSWSNIEYFSQAADRNGYHWDIAFSSLDSNQCLIAKGEYAHGKPDGKGVYSYHLTTGNSNLLPGTAGAGFMQVETGNALDTVFLASHSSGVWETFDGGVNWNTKEAGLLERTIQRFHISAQTHRPRFCITRTDSINWFSASNTEVGGFYSWDDMAQAWTPANNSLPKVAMSDLWVSPAEDVLIATTFNHGAYKSTDGGLNWNALPLPFSNLRLFAVEGSPKNPDLILLGDKNKGVWYSMDGGMQWSDLTDNSLFCPSINDLELGDDGTLYAATLGGSVYKTSSPLITQLPPRNWELAEMALVAYPNPSSGKFNILPPQKSTFPIAIQVYSTKGGLLFEQLYRNEDEEIEIDLTRQPAGMYLLRMSNNNWNANQLIVRHN